MAAVLRRRNAPPPARGPPPLKIRPQCGGHVVTFDGDALGFSSIDLNGTPVVSEASVEGVEVGDPVQYREIWRAPAGPPFRVLRGRVMAADYRPVAAGGLSRGLRAPRDPAQAHLVKLLLVHSGGRVVRYSDFCVIDIT